MKLNRLIVVGILCYLSLLNARSFASETILEKILNLIIQGLLPGKAAGFLCFHLISRSLI